jgi:hypothetical protein
MLNMVLYMVGQGNLLVVGGGVLGGGHNVGPHLFCASHEVTQNGLGAVLGSASRGFLDHPPRSVPVLRGVGPCECEDPL